MPELAKPKYEQSHAPNSTTVLYFNGDLTSVDSVMWVVELNRAAYEPLDAGSLSQPRVLDGASCSMANNSPQGC
jgi:hypothetical protein